MLRKLRRLSELSPGELLVFSQLVLFALIARIALKFLPLPRISAFIAYAGTNSLLRSFPLFHRFRDISRITRLADFAARGTRADGPCLIRSLLLLWLLKARGEQARLLIGVRKEAGQFTSHAWIEAQGSVIVDEPEMIRRYATLLQF